MISDFSSISTLNPKVTYIVNDIYWRSAKLQIVLLQEVLLTNSVGTKGQLISE